MKEVETLSKNLFQSDSFIAGLAQGFSVLPGISRSGITVSAILIEKYTQKDALILSFLISVPAAIGSILVDIIFGQGSVFGSLDVLTILFITIISFLVGYATIESFLKIAKRVELGYFCIIYGVLSYVIIIPFFFLA